MHHFNYRLTIVITMIVSLFIQSCSKTVEGETKTHESNQQMINELKMKYPKFADAIDAKFKESEAAWQQASGVSGEEEKIKAMAQANSIISYSFIPDLNDVTSRINDLQNKERDLQRTNNTDYQIRPMLSIAYRDIDNCYRYVNNSLDRGASSPEEAKNVISGITTAFTTANQSIDAVMKMINEKTRLENEKKNQAELNNKQNTDTQNNNTQNSNNSGSDKQSTETVTSTWKCGYCSATNDAELTSCKGCSAPK